MTDDLTTWLRERLDDDERMALAASGRQWGHDGYLGWHSPFGSSHCTVFHEMNPFSHQQNTHVCGSALPADAEHIARHDPSRVLAEVAAKRRIVDLHAHRDGPHECPEWKWRDPEHPEDPQESETGWAVECATLRLLALPYSGHSEYRSEWEL